MLLRFFLLFCFLFCISASAAEFTVSEAMLERVRQQYGEEAYARMKSWQDLLSNTDEMSETQKLRKVNDFFNNQRFVNDIDHWGQEDYWATPVELLATGGGDCEDFSIAKYYTLRELGVPDEKLRVTYVMALEYDQAHMVLSYFEKPNTEPLILDNLNKRILPAGQRQDLKPVYNFNGDGLWVARQRGGGKRVGKADGISRWMKLRERFKKSVQSELGKE